MLRYGAIVRAIDTNVVARYLLNDDPVQSPIARDVIGEGVFVAHTVLVELAWLLGSRYRQPRSVVAAALANLIDIPSVETVDVEQVRWAIGRIDGGADFADMMHVIAAREIGSFTSFEKHLAKKAGRDAPVSIETLD